MDLPQIVETFTLECRIEDLDASATSDTTGYLYAVPLAHFLPMAGEDPVRYERVKAVKIDFTDGFATDDLLAGIQWRITFHWLDREKQPSPLIITGEAGQTVNLALIGTAEAETAVEVRTVLVDGVATLVQLQELDADKQDAATLDTDTATLLDDPDSNLRASADARYGSGLRLGPTFAVVGDSLVEGGSDSANGVYRESWPLYFQALASGRARLVHYSGHPGYTTTQLASHTAAAIASGATYIFYGGGTNDLIVGAAAATTKANIVAFVVACQAAGKLPILVTLPPSSTTGHVASIIALNSWIRGYAESLRIPVLDFHALLVDPANGSYLSAYANDGVHPNGAGYEAMGTLAYNQLTQYLPPASADLARVDSDATNLTGDKSCFVTDTNADGTPDGWGAYGGTSGYTQATATDSAVTGKKIVVTGTSMSADRVVYRTSSATITPGHKIAIMGWLKVSAYTSGNGATVKVVFNGGSKTLYPVYRHRYLTSGFYYMEWVVPAGTTSIETDLIVSSGTVTAAWAQPTIRDLTALGLA